ncbi:MULTISPECIES: serine/threonine-protein kinase [unclassified Frankia]
MLTPLMEDDPRQIGPYRLQNRIGAGGMGTVYLGFAPDRRPVAVKVAAEDLAEDEEFRSRFEREVRAALRVRGTAVAAVLDADTEAAAPWMVTEYVEGTSLAEAVRARGRLEDHLVRGLAVGLADALVAIHAAGVVHRDLKPSNILLAWDGPKVIDFGIAHLTDSATLTRTGHVIGTLAWMSPEQMRGEPSDASADVFAWASCMTYAATGRHPFHAETPDLLAVRVQRDSPDHHALPGYLLNLVARALSKAPRERPDAASLLAALVGREVRGVTEADPSGGWAPDVQGPGPAPGLWPVGPPPPASAFRPAVLLPPAAPPRPVSPRPVSPPPSGAVFPGKWADQAPAERRGATAAADVASDPGRSEVTYRPSDPTPPARPPDPSAFPPAGRPAALRVGLWTDARRAEAPRRRHWNSGAMLSVLLAVLWIFGIGSAAAVVVGLVARVRIRRRDERGATVAAVGIGLGWLGIGLAMILIVVILKFV